MKPQLLFAFLVIFNIVNAQDTWVQKTPFAGDSRLGAVGFSIGSKGYIGTGYVNPGNVVLEDFWEWNPSTNSWTQKANFGGGKCGWAMGTSIGPKGYIGLGYNLSEELGHFWEYDTISNSWTEQTLFSGAPSSQGVCFAIGSNVYILGGSSDFWEFNTITKIWSSKAYYPGTGFVSQTGFSIGDKGYIGLGRISQTEYSNEFWEYNPTSNTWTLKAEFPGPGRSAAVGFSIGSRGYIGTGSAGPGGGSNLFKDFWEYNPATNSWRQRANFGGTARSVATGFSIGNKGYVGLGWDASSSGVRKDFWEYTPDTTTSGTEELKIQNSISIFPNPLKIETTIYANTVLKNATLIIYNSLGQIAKQLNNISGESILIKRDNLPAGLYVVQLMQDQKTFNSNKYLVIIDN